MKLDDEILDINGFKAKWIRVKNHSVGDYIAVPDYENNKIKLEKEGHRIEKYRKFGILKSILKINKKNQNIYI